MNRKNWLKRIGSMMLAICLTLGLVAEWLPIIGQASNAYTELTMEDFGFPFGEYTGENYSSKTPITGFDGVAITDTFKFETDANVDGIATDVRIGAANGWEAPISLMVASGALYAWNYVPGNTGLSIKLADLSVSTAAKIRMEFNVDGTDLVVKYYVNDMENVAVTQTYPASTFSPNVLVYGAQGKKITIGAKKEYKEYTFADYGIAAGEYTGQIDNTTTPTETTLDGVAITETLKLSADRDAYVRIAGVTASGWEAPIDLYHADGVLYSYDQTPNGTNDFQLHTSLAAGTEFTIRMEFDYVGEDVVVNFYINNMDTPLNTHTYEGYASKFTHKILMYTQNGAKITVGKKEDEPTVDSLGYTKVTIKDDYGFADDTYQPGQVVGNHRVSEKEVDLHNKYIDMDITVNGNTDANALIFLSSDGWSGIKVSNANDVFNIYNPNKGVAFGMSFDAATLGISSIKAQFNLKLGFELGTLTGTTYDTVKVTAWANDTYIGQKVFDNVINCGKKMGIYTAETGATLVIGTPGSEGGGDDTPKEYTKMTFADFGFPEGTYTGENFGTKHATLTSLDGIAIEDDVTFENENDTSIRLGAADGWQAPISFLISGGALYSYDYTVAPYNTEHSFKLTQVAAGTKFKLRMEFDVAGEDVKVTFYVNENRILDHTYAGYADKILPQMMVYGGNSKKVIIGEPYIDPYTVLSFKAFGFPAGEYTKNTVGTKAIESTLDGYAIVDEFTLVDAETSQIHIGTTTFGMGIFGFYIKDGKLYVNDYADKKGPKDVELATVAANEKFKLRIEFTKIKAVITEVKIYVNDMKNPVLNKQFAVAVQNITPQASILGKVIVGTPSGEGGGSGEDDEPIGPETYTVVSFAEFGFGEGHYTGENRNTITPAEMTNFSNVAIVDTVTFEEEVSTRIGIGASTENMWWSPITLYIDKGQLYVRDHLNVDSGHYFSVTPMIAKQQFKLRIEFDYSGDDVTVKFYVDKMGAPAITREYTGYADKIKPTVFIYGADNKHVSIGNPEPIPEWPTTFTELTLESFGFPEEVYTGENYGVQPEGITSLDGVAIEDTVKFEVVGDTTSVRIGNPSGWEGYLSFYIDTNPGDNNNEWLYVRNYVDPNNSDYYFPLAKMAKNEKFKFRFEFSAYGDGLRVRYYINDMETPITERTYKGYKDLFVPRIMLYGGEAKNIFVRDAVIPEIVYTEKTFADFGIEDGLYVSESKGTDSTLESLDKIFLKGTITLGGYATEADVRIGAEDYWQAPIHLYISNDPLTGENMLWAWDSLAAVTPGATNFGLKLCPMAPGEKFELGMRFLYKGDDVIVTYYVNDMENPIASYKYVGYAKEDAFKPNMLVYNTNGSVTVIGDRTVDTAWPTEFTELTFEDFGFPEGAYTGANFGKQLSYKSMEAIAIEEKIAFEDDQARTDIRFGNTDGWQGYISLYLQDGMIWVRDYYEAEVIKTSNNFFALCAMNPEEKFTLRMEFDVLDTHVRVRFYVDGEPIVEHIYNDYANVIKPTMMIYGGAAKNVLVRDAVVEKIDYKELTFADFGIKDGEYTTRVTGTPKDKKIKTLHGIAITETITFSSPSANIRIGAKDDEGWLAPLDIQIADNGWLYSWNEIDRTLNSARLAEVAAYEQFKLRVEFKYSGKTVIAVIYVNDMTNPVTAMTFQNYADKIAPRVMVYGSDGNALLIGKGTLSKPKPIVQATPEELGYEQISLPQFGIKGGTFKKQAGTDYSHTYGSFQEGDSVSGKYLDIDVAFQGKNVNAGETSIRYASADGWRGISIGVEGGSLRVFNASVGGGYTFSLEQLGLKSFDKTFNIKLGVKTGKKYNVGTPKEAQDLTFCLWVNDKLVAKDAKLSQVEAVGDGLGIFVSKNTLKVNAPKGMRGVDFTLFGFTNKWEKELGIK